MSIPPPLSSKSFFIRLFTAIALIGLASCAGPRGCSTRISDLKTQYPHVVYRGPKKPREIEIKKSVPAGWVTLAQISKKAQGAVIVSEDWAFYQHEGFDSNQIREVIEDSLAAGKMTRGASTITQQVAKNIFLSHERSLSRKARELWIATKLEKTLGKKRILELYFNIAEWGEGVFGIRRAAQVYFNKHPSELTAKEGAFLAMLLPSPKKYSVSYRKHELTAYARRTIRSILAKMVQAKYLTPEERDQEWVTPLSFEASFDPVISPEDRLEHGEDEVLDDASQNGIEQQIGPNIEESN